MESVLPTDSDIVILPVLKRDGDEGRVVRYHLKFAYHDTIVKVSRYTLSIDTSNVHMINDLHKTARTPFYVETQFY